MAKGVPVVATSALTAGGIEELLPAVTSLFDKWRSRIPTPKLNEWLYEAQAKQAPPAKGGAVYRSKKTVSGPLRIKYMTQPSSRPPTFVLFVNRFKPPADVLPEAYQRYLISSMRTRFAMEGVPMRFTVKGNSMGAKRRREGKGVGGRPAAFARGKLFNKYRKYPSVSPDPEDE